MRISMNPLENLPVVIISTCVALIGLELTLSLFPVTEVSRTKPLTEKSTPFEVSAEANSEFTFSRGRDFRNSRIRHTNSLGFFSDFDYQIGEKDIIVIGDSYVEAAAVDFEKTFHQILSKALREKIYNFGISGAPLSQYEAYLSEACQKFLPKKVIIPIIANDFSESLYEHRRGAGFFHYHENGILKPTPRKISLLRRALSRSSLIRYWYFHLGGAQILSSTHNGTEKMKREKAIHKIAATYFLDNIKNYCVDAKNIIFLVDANRSQDGIYGDNKRLEHMSGFISKSQRLGYTVIDLTPSMKREFLKTGLRYEFPYDGHWNSQGHKFVAKQIIDLLSEN